ncbi:DUF3662 domain-containing protein [Actinomyces sp. zg-332]|uniref:FhaA domain-containing protein n=1 Tax=Actinomyces sp. zg-332 TaxID=2708340 RepID=UPI001420464C|nr:DUF3662 and FHA domain-containing protein [Actinomyces sp. zg-332]QPK94172.1 DUF3662 domain-containing protein [Actinomyces sp. zg-332]
MGYLKKIEKGLERAIKTPFNKHFKTEVKAVDIVSAIKQEMDDKVADVSKTRTIAPNDFIISLSSSDMEQLEQWGIDTMAEEAVQSATNHAMNQRYSFVGPVNVNFTVDDVLPTGTLQVVSTTRRGAIAPATTSSSAQHPILEIDGTRYLLTGAVTVLGRGSDCDIVINDTGISRRHLQIQITPERVVAKDLGSTNGTYIEGHRTDIATLVDGNQITIGRTRILFWASPDDENYQ